MGKVRKPISAVKKANIKSNKSHKKSKADKRRKVKYGKKTDIEDRKPVTYYDHKKLRDKAKMEKIELAKQRKAKLEKGKEDPEKKSYIPLRRVADVDDMLDPEQLEAMIRGEDTQFMEALGDEGPNAEAQRSNLLEKAKKLLLETEGPDEGAEEEVFASKEEELHNKIKAKAAEEKLAAKEALAAEVAARPRYSLLPIKVDGKVIQRPLPDADTGDAEDSGVERDAEPEPRPCKPVLGPLPRVSTLDLLVQRKRKIHDKKVFIGCAATRITRNPDASMHSLQELVKLVYESDPDIALTVRRMAALSLVVVFNSILPSYQLGTLETPGVKLKKETRAVALQEGKLLTRYKFYLRGLEAMLTNAARHKFTPLHLKMASVALRCLCEMLYKHPVFNFSDNIITLLVPYLSHTVDDLRKIVVETFEKMFYEDNQGKLSLRLLRVINKHVRKADFKVHSDSLRVLLQLRVARATALDTSIARKVETARETARTKQNLKKVASKHAVKMSISEKKRKHKVAKLENKLAEKKRAQEKTHHDTIQTEMLHILFGLYVHVVKNSDKNTKLIGVVLEGLATFGHLVNVEYFCDLLSNLERVLNTANLTLVETIHCIQTVFRLLTGLGSALPNDPSAFSDRLYAQLMRISYTPDGDKSLLPALRTLILVFIGCKKRVGMKQTVGFVKRLATLALSLPHHLNIPLMLTLRSIMLNHRGTECLLDTSREGGWGVYRPDLDSPEHSNACISTLWETHLMALSYHPMSRLVATHLYKGAPLLGDGCLPPSFTKKNVDDVYNDYDCTETKLNPEMPLPEQHCGQRGANWNNKKRKQVAEHRLPPMLQEMCEVEEKFLDRLMRCNKKQTAATASLAEDADVDISDASAKDGSDDEAALVTAEHKEALHDDQPELIEEDAIEEMDFYPFSTDHVTTEVEEDVEDFTKYFVIQGSEEETNET